MTTSDREEFNKAWQVALVQDYLGVLWRFEGMAGISYGRGARGNAVPPRESFRLG